MTGGSLPAMTWHEMMAPAHQSVELRPIPGVPATPGGKDAVASASGAKGFEVAASPQRPAVLNPRALDAIGGIDSMMKSLATRRGPSASLEIPVEPGRSGGVRSIGGRMALQ
jgi:penicillin-binding protein 1A